MVSLSSISLTLRDRYFGAIGDICALMTLEDDATFINFINGSFLAATITLLSLDV